MGASRLGAWLTYTLLVPLDRFLYARSGGRVSLSHLGTRGEGALPTLLLTTTGRRSGEPRSNPVLYLADGEHLVVVASNFGRGHHPAWSANLLAEPRASILLRGRRREVTARLADDAEKDALWPRLVEMYPGWEAYRHRTDRPFRAFFLKPDGA
jgi:deazaflavin-dependent oxidoreductase (nitroreductase family)